MGLASDTTTIFFIRVHPLARSYLFEQINSLLDLFDLGQNPEIFTKNRTGAEPGSFGLSQCNARYPLIGDKF